MGTITRTAAALVAAAVLAACHARPVETAPSLTSCDSTRGPLPDGASLAGRAGSYTLMLVAANGPKAGSVAQGRLVLTPSSRGGTSGERYTLQGMSDLRLELVGASAPGSTTTTESSRPGVLVMEYPRGAAAGPRDVTIRFGSDANVESPAQSRFDGQHMALFVNAITDAGFSGRWGSGQDARLVSGHFCASRM